MNFKSQLLPVAVFLFSPLLASAAAEIQVSSDFPGGSGLAEVDQQARTVRLVPSDHKDRGWACWWYVKLSGLTPGETIVLDVGEAPWATPDRAVISYDNRHWSHTVAGQREGRRIRYRQPVDRDCCWFAWGPPFVPADAQSLVDWAAASCPDATAFELCKTRAGRSVPALSVNAGSEDQPPRRGIWIQARQHAWESGSSWVCRGFVEWLVSDDPRAESLRTTAEIVVVPVMDIDNVAIGAGGKSQQPQDHNRDWSDEPHWNSVRAAMAGIKRLDQHGRFDLFVDLHNPGANDRSPFFFTPPSDQLSERGQLNLERFVAASRLEITGPLPLSDRTRTSGPGYDKNWKKISKNWVAVNTREHVVAVTLETSWNTPHSTTAGYRAVGRQLGLAIERYLRTSQ